MANKDGSPRKPNVKPGHRAVRFDLPDAVYDGLVKLAEDDDRTLHHYVVRLLREHCEGMLPLEP